MNATQQQHRVIEHDDDDEEEDAHKLLLHFLVDVQIYLSSSFNIFHYTTILFDASVASVLCVCRLKHMRCVAKFVFHSRFRICVVRLRYISGLMKCNVLLEDDHKEALM